jgi:2-oxoglutarate ferredoxin oxidoreductase subunit delta
MHVRVFVDTRLCKGCHICMRFCPRSVLEISGTSNEMGVFPVIVKSPERCTGCGLCSLYCPDFAISVEKMKEKK